MDDYHPDDHQRLALQTWYKPEESIDLREQINQAMLQLASEAGELAGSWAKHLYKPNRELSRDDVLDELGDIWYYVRIIAHLYNISIYELTDSNFYKLLGGHGWTGSAEKINSRG